MSNDHIDTASTVLAGALPPDLERPLLCRWSDDKPIKGSIVFCHGLGSNAGEYAELSSHWAEHGYLVIHPTFDDAIAVVVASEPALGLDPAADLRRWVRIPELRKHMHYILHSPARWLERVATVRAILNELPKIQAETCGTLHASLPVAVAGHSFGAYTAQLLAGAEIDLPDDPDRSFADPRISAAIFLSGQGRDQQGLRDGSWDRVTIPTLTVTGTRDKGANGGDWEWKSEPFTQASAPEQYLAVLEDGDHFLGGFDADDHRNPVPAQAAAVRELTQLFLDSVLQDDADARTNLRATTDHIGDCQLTFQYR